MVDETAFINAYASRSAKRRIEEAQTEKRVIQRDNSDLDHTSEKLNDIGEMNFSSNEVAQYQPKPPSDEQESN